MSSRDREFAELVGARSQALHRFGYLLTGDWARAEDLVQSAWVETWSHWHRLRDTASAEAYARRTMARLSARWWRRRGSREVVASHVPDGPAADGFGRSDDRTVLAEALDQLSPRQRAVVILRFYEDLSEADAAKVLGWPRGTVKSTTSRGLARLRDLLDTEVREPPPVDIHHFRQLIEGGLP